MELKAQEEKKRDYAVLVGLCCPILRQDNAEVAFQLEEQYGILTRCGLHCAPLAHKTLGTYPEGTVRFSVGYATTEEEVDAAIRAIHDLA